MSDKLTIKDILEWSNRTKVMVEAACGKHSHDNIDLSSMINLMITIMNSDELEFIEKFNNIIKFIAILPVSISRLFYYDKSNLKSAMGSTIFNDKLTESKIRLNINQVFPNGIFDILKFSFYKIISKLDNDKLSIKDKIALINLDYRYLGLFPKPNKKMYNEAARMYIKENKTGFIESFRSLSHYRDANVDSDILMFINHCSKEHQKEIMKISSRVIKFVQNPSKEMIDLAIDINTRNIIFFDDLEEDEYIKAINRRPEIISFIKKRTPAMIKKALTLDGSLIYFIPDKDEVYQLLAADYIDPSESYYVQNVKKSLMELLLEADWICSSFLTKLEYMPKFSRYKESIRSHKNYVGLAQNILNKIEGVDE